MLSGDPASVEGGSIRIAGLWTLLRVQNVTVLFAARSVAISDCGCAASTETEAGGQQNRLLFRWVRCTRVFLTAYAAHAYHMSVAGRLASWAHESPMTMESQKSLVSKLTQIDANGVAVESAK